ncbi:MAG: protein translocase subunit SecD [Candidatus Kapabacteria bacterium]|nr:protein translocase subunit SecD [Candidatus Kapabacteria bacterium]
MMPDARHRILSRIDHLQNYIESWFRSTLYIRGSYVLPFGLEEFLKKRVLSRDLLIILPLLAAGYLMWPTYRYYQLDKERTAIMGDSVALENWDRANGEAFDVARNGRIKLGLDLRGGMYVTLEVDVLKLIEESADEQSTMGDDVFQRVVDKTRKETDNTDLDVLEVFLKNFRAENRSLLQYFTVADATDVTEEAVEKKLRRNVDEAIDQALEVIKQRINKFQVSEAQINKQGARRIVLELPDVKDEKEIRNLLQTTARLEFNRVIMGKDLVRAFMGVDQVLRGGAVVADTAAADTTAMDSTAAVKDSTAVASADSAKVDTAKKASDSSAKNPYAGLSDDEVRRRYRKDHPFTSMLASFVIANERLQPFDFVGKTLNDFPDAEYRFLVDDKNVDRLARMLERPEVRRAMPIDMQVLIGAKPDEFYAKQQVTLFDVYGVSREPLLTGDVIEEAYPSFDPASTLPVVNMSMNADGAERWAAITGANIGKRIAIVLDGRVYSAPVVQGRIPNGNSQISGMSGAEEANVLAVVLKAGALKAPVKIIEERIVGPSLGEDSIRRGVTSSLISFVLIVLFMLVYYALGGGIADIALLMNVMLMIAILAGFGGTLTLPGIAGIILSVAMAVDANILVFERIREELAMGKTLRQSIDQGFGKAMSAIIDSNLTNVLSGIVLYFLGTGPVKGFAVTLIIGVLTTMFTAVLVSRAMFELIAAGGATTFNFGQRKTA